MLPDGFQIHKRKIAFRSHRGMTVRRTARHRLDPTVRSAGAMIGSLGLPGADPIPVSIEQTDTEFAHARSICRQHRFCVGWRHAPTDSQSSCAARGRNPRHHAELTLRSEEPNSMKSLRSCACNCGLWRQGLSVVGMLTIRWPTSQALEASPQLRCPPDDRACGLGRPVHCQRDGSHASRPHTAP